MGSCLEKIKNWPSLAAISGYNAADLAMRCGVSLRQLQRFFLKTTHKTPQVWLNELRQQEAMILLMGSGQNIREVAFKLGYKQATHFSREFKRIHGVPPSLILASKQNVAARYENVAIR